MAERNIDQIVRDELYKEDEYRRQNQTVPNQGDDEAWHSPDQPESYLTPDQIKQLRLSLRRRINWDVVQSATNHPLLHHCYVHGQLLITMDKPGIHPSWNSDWIPCQPTQQIPRASMTKSLGLPLFIQEQCGLWLLVEPDGEWLVYEVHERGGVIEAIPHVENLRPYIDQAAVGSRLFDALDQFDKILVDAFGQQTQRFALDTFLRRDNNLPG